MVALIRLAGRLAGSGIWLIFESVKFVSDRRRSSLGLLRPQNEMCPSSKIKIHSDDWSRSLLIFSKSSRTSTWVAPCPLIYSRLFGAPQRQAKVSSQKILGYMSYLVSI